MLELSPVRKDRNLNGLLVFLTACYISAFVYDVNYFHFFWQSAEIVPSALVLFILRKLPPRHVSDQYQPISRKLHLPFEPTLKLNLLDDSDLLQFNYACMFFTYYLSCIFFFLATGTVPINTLWNNNWNAGTSS